MYKLGSGLSFSNLHRNCDQYRIDTAALIIYNYFLMFLVARADMDWPFYPFKNDFIAERIGLQFLKPEVSSKFGPAYRSLTILFNSCGLLPLFARKRKYQNWLIPVLIWDVYTVSALAENFLETVISIISLEVSLKAILSVSLCATFVILLYLKLLLQVFNFYEHHELVK